MRLKSRSTKYSYTLTLATIGQTLTQLRIRKGYIKRLDFTTDYDLPHIQYWRMEKGTANLTFKSLDKVLRIHNMTIEQLFLVLVTEKKPMKTGKVKVQA